MESRREITVKRIVLILAFALAAFHVANIWYIFPMNTLRGVHLGFVIVLTYFKGGGHRNSLIFLSDIVKSIAAVAACAHYTLNFDVLANRTAMSGLDKIMGVILILVIVDMTYRVVGVGMGAITTVFLVYLFVGRFLPGVFNHAGFTVNRIIGHLYISANGVFGSLLQISATYIALFTILGAFFEHCGASNSFINLAMKLTSRLQGGPALAAVIASCLFGMINGSAVVNVVTTGTFTIPLMKQVGIAPYVAGAVEAAASTGGQLMPPVMGAGAFIMSDILGIPYSQIIIKALVPALVYFISIFAGVYFYVKREEIPAVDPKLIPDVGSILKGLYLLLPMVVVMVMILVGYSPGYSAIFGIATAFGLIVLNNRSKPLSLAKKVFSSLTEGSLGLTTVAIGLAAAGLIVGVVTLTGVGNRFVIVVVEISHGNGLLALMLVALACLVLGMGLPTSAAYIVASSMAVPAMVEIGLPRFPSHLFIFYFAVIAPITPPVAIAAYTGAGIAGASPSKTGFKAFVFAIPAFLVPFLFVYNPVLLAEGELFDILTSAVTAIVGSAALAAATQGYFMGRLNVPLRFLLFVAAVLMLVPGVVSDAIGIGGTLAVGLISYRQTKMRKSGAA